jgi:hypothetical protein
MSIKAMKQSLDVLELMVTDISWYGDSPTKKSCIKAAKSLRQAIAEAEKQEPVAWMYEWGGNKHLTFVDQRFIEKAHPHFNKSTPLYTAPVHASNISQERVDETAKDKHEFECPRCGHCCQQREWVGLTDKDIYDIREGFIYNDEDFNEVGFARAIEAKLKEKNA